MPTEELFQSFPKSTAKQWKQRIQFELGGIDYNATLLTKTLEGIDIKPFYHLDELKKHCIPPKGNNFNICQSIFISEVKTANHLALDSLERGATSLAFIAHEPFDVEVLLKKIPDTTPLHFDLGFNSESFIKELYLHKNRKHLRLNLDPIGKLVKDGNWFKSRSTDFEVLKQVLNSSPDFASLIKVDASTYQNSGANCIQQLAYAMAHANEYLNFIDQNLRSKKIINFNFKMAIGSHYFFEIAKLKALAVLWEVISEAYDFDTNFTIFSEPSKRNKSLYDYNTNILRTTTECMSAIIGGADTISNLAYDSVYHRKNEFGERIARNQLLILQHEAYFSDAKNSAQGSYYLETLTHDFAKKALGLFKEIEKGGGFLKQLKEGTIQRKIKETAASEQELFDTKELVLIGTNKQENAEDRMSDTIELYPFVKTKHRKTLIEPIISRRLAEKIEQKRLQDEA